MGNEFAPDSIFSYDPKPREIRTRTGRLGYFDEDWHGLSGDIKDTITGKVDNLKALATKKGEGWGSMGQSQVESAVKGFNDFGLKNMREGYADRKLKEAADQRADGLAETKEMNVPNSRVTTVAQAQANLDRRIQGFTEAKKKIRAANQTVDAAAGTAFTYSETGFERLDPKMDDYYAQFDREITKAQDMYATEHGYSSWDEVADGFGMFASNQVERVQTSPFGHTVWDYTAPMVDGKYQAKTYMSTEQNTRAHKEDIMSFILSDMTGISADDLVYMSTADIGYDWEKEGMSSADRAGEAQNVSSEMLSSMRDTYAKIFYGSANAANKAAEGTDMFRAQAAKEAKKNTMTAQARMSEASENSTAEAVMELNAGIRTAEQEYESTKYRLLSGGIGGKRKVKDVSFKDTRPE